MTGAEIIREVQEQVGEYLEMHENPAEMLAGILANKIVQLNDHIQYLEKRIQFYDYLKRKKSDIRD